MLSVAKEAYSFAINIDGVREYFNHAIDRYDYIFVRGNSGFCMAVLVQQPWRFGDIDCEMEYLCAIKSKHSALEIVKIVKYINVLRKSKGCARFYLNSRLADLKFLAKRLGATHVGNGYVIEG